MKPARKVSKESSVTHGIPDVSSWLVAHSVPR